MHPPLFVVVSSYPFEHLFLSFGVQSWYKSEILNLEGKRFVQKFKGILIQLYLL